MNEIMNKFLLAVYEFKPEMQLRLSTLLVGHSLRRESI